MNQRSKVAVLLAVLFAVSVPAAACGEPAEQAQSMRLNIATGGTSGVYFPLGGALASVLNANVPNVQATAHSTGGSVVNARLIARGDVQLAFIQNDIAFYAATGTEMFEDDGELTALKGVATLYPEVIQIITLERTGIKSIADLRGKRVAVGALGSGTEANTRQILAAFGVSYEDLNSAEYLSADDAVSNLKDRDVDAAFVTAAFPTSAISDFAASSDLVIVPITGDPVEDLIEEYPFYTRVKIPANTYFGQTADVDTVAVKAMLVANADLAAGLVEAITRALFDHAADLAAAHEQGSNISRESGRDGMSIELHPGAAAIFGSE